MNEKELKELLHSWGDPNLTARYIVDHPECVNILMNIALNDNHSKNYKAVWVAEKVHDLQPKFILPYLPAMTSFVMTTRNSGKKRHLLKLISLHPIQQEDVALLLDFCIGIFTNAAEEIAVRVHAMQILFNIALLEPDFTGELIGLIENEIEHHGSAGIRSRGNKLLQKLYSKK